MRLVLLAAIIAAAGPAAAQSMPGYSYGRGPDGKPFWQQCNRDGYCFGRTGDPADGGGKPFWFQQAPDQASAPIKRRPGQ
jgi:hypothetical protein